MCCVCQARECLRYHFSLCHLMHVWASSMRLRVIAPRLYARRVGRAPSDWFDTLADMTVRGAVVTRIKRLECGLIGDVDSVTESGISRGPSDRGASRSPPYRRRKRPGATSPQLECRRTQNRHFRHIQIRYDREVNKRAMDAYTAAPTPPFRYISLY